MAGGFSMATSNSVPVPRLSTTRITTHSGRKSGCARDRARYGSWLPPVLQACRSARAEWAATSALTPDEMFAQEPDLHLVSPNHVAHQQVVRSSSPASAARRAMARASYRMISWACGRREICTATVHSPVGDTSSWPLWVKKPLHYRNATAAPASTTGKDQAQFPSKAMA